MTGTSTRKRSQPFGKIRANAQKMANPCLKCLTVFSIGLFQRIDAAETDHRITRNLLYMPAQVIRLSSRRFQEKRAPLQRTPLATALPIGQQSTQLLRIELSGIPEPAGHITFHHIRILREIGLKQALQLRPRRMADIEKTPLVQQIGRIQQSSRSGQGFLSRFHPEREQQMVS